MTDRLRRSGDAGTRRQSEEQFLREHGWEPSIHAGMWRKPDEPYHFSQRVAMRRQRREDAEQRAREAHHEETPDRNH